MALRNLTTETMLALSTAWTDPQRGRDALEASVAAPLLPKLEEAHAELVATAGPVVEEAAERELADLQAQEADLDRTHDRKVRGTYHLLTGLSELADDPAVATSRLTLRDALLPTGLAATQRSYLAEAGDVEALDRRLNDNQRRALAEITIAGGGSLAAEVDAWTSAARTLGELEGKRAELAARRLAGPSAARPASATRARHRWLRVVKAMAQTIALDDTLTPRLDEAFVTPLRLAEAKADRKARAGRAGDEGGEPAGDEIGEGAGILGGAAGGRPVSKGRGRRGAGEAGGGGRSPAGESATFGGKRAPQRDAD